jgi:hypothetical protein
VDVSVQSESENEGIRFGSMDTDSNIVLLRVGGHDSEADNLEATQKKELVDIASGNPTTNYKAAIYRVLKPWKGYRYFEIKNKDGELETSFGNQTTRTILTFVVLNDGSFRISKLQYLSGSKFEGGSGDLCIKSVNDLAKLHELIQKFLAWSKTASEQSLEVDEKPLGELEDYIFKFSHSKDDNGLGMLRVVSGSTNFLLTDPETPILEIMMGCSEQLQVDAKHRVESKANEKARADELLK